MAGSAGPERYLVEKAVKLNEEQFTVQQIVERLQESIETSASFVIPVDFEFLKRSGRLTSIAAKIGGIIKIVPVMTQTPDKRRITPFVVKRSKKKVIEAIIEHFKSLGVDAEYKIYISHADSPDDAENVRDQIKKHFPETETEVLMLSPTLMTHGGPGCILIQTIKK